MITYREMKESDVPALLDMIWKMWAGPKVKARPEIAIHYAEMVLYFELLYSTAAFVSDDNGRAVGVCVVDIKKNHKLHEDYLMKYIDAAVLMAKDHDGLENLKHSMNAQRVFNESEEVLEGKNFGAEVTLFINDADHRGQGIGSGMFSHVADYLNKNGVEKFYLHSDESSFHHFYGIHRGMEQIDSRPSNGSLGSIDNVTLYIYGDTVANQMDR